MVILVKGSVDKRQVARLLGTIGRAAKSHWNALRFKRRTTSEDVIEVFKKLLPLEAGKGLPNGLREPISAVEHLAMGVIHEFNDMVGPAHDNDETWGLFEQVDLTFSGQALALFGQKSIRGFRADPKQPDDNAAFRLRDRVVGEGEMRFFRRAMLVDPVLDVVHMD